MKGLAHFISAAILGLSVLFFGWIYFVSGQFCGEVSCGFEASYANSTFLSVGLLCAFVFCTEALIGAKSMKSGKLLLAESPGQGKYITKGRWLIVVGALLALLGFYAFNSTMVMCPSGGCSQSELLAVYGPSEGLFLLGLGLVGLGEVLILRAKFKVAAWGPRSQEIQHQTSDS